VYGGQIIPPLEKGYLMFMDPPNRLQVFGPDTQLSFPVPRVRAPRAVDVLPLGLP
jgi:hypothetical protein